MDLLPASMKECFGSVSSQLKLWLPDLVAEEVRRSMSVALLHTRGVLGRAFG